MTNIIQNPQKVLFDTITFCMKNGYDSLKLNNDDYY